MKSTSPSWAKGELVQYIAASILGFPALLAYEAAVPEPLAWPAGIITTLVWCAGIAKVAWTAAGWLVPRLLRLRPSPTAG